MDGFDFSEYNLGSIIFLTLFGYDLELNRIILFPVYFLCFFYGLFLCNKFNIAKYDHFIVAESDSIYQKLALYFFTINCLGLIFLIVAISVLVCLFISFILKELLVLSLEFFGGHNFVYIFTDIELDKQFYLMCSASFCLGCLIKILNRARSQYKTLEAMIKLDNKSSEYLKIAIHRLSKYEDTRHLQIDELS